jgi:hypothetical protein
MAEEPPRRVGKLPPQYTFVLNPHAETRVGQCPICGEQMHQRKVPLFIHVEPFNPVVLGYTCRYCPDCDLLIAHQDQIEALLAGMFAQHAPEVIGNDYLVVGTVERDYWRQGLKQPGSIGDMLEHLHDFKEVLTLGYRPAGWYPADEPEDREEAAVKPAAEEKQLARPAAAAAKPRRRQRRKRSKRR